MLNCQDCKKEIKTGYGVDKNNRKICYKCCAVNDVKALMDNGKGKLYFTENNPLKTHFHINKGKMYAMEGKQPAGYVSNWPESLKIPVSGFVKSRHNFGCFRVDFNFTLKGVKFWEYQIGDNNQVAHVQKYKV